MHGQIDVGLESLLNVERLKCLFNKFGEFGIPDQLHSAVGSRAGLENDRVGFSFLLNSRCPCRTAWRVARRQDRAQCRSSKRDGITALENAIDLDGFPTFVSQW